MDGELEWVVTNARIGRGPCESCVAQLTDNCEHITPGYGFLDAAVLFVRKEPVTGIHWDVQPPWDSSGEIVYHSYEWKEIQDALRERFLSPLDLGFDDIWVTATIKCPPAIPEQETQQFDPERAFAPCSEYLRREIRQVDPAVIVTLGCTATVRTLRVLGADSPQLSPSVIDEYYGVSPGDTDPPIVVAPATGTYPADDPVYEAVRSAITEQRYS